MSGRRTSDEDFSNLVRRLDAWKIPSGVVDRVYDLARASLNEVKTLTEYEDGKVSRLLTIIAFLSAVVGAVFARFAGDYSVPSIVQPALTGAWILPAITYAAFAAYVLLVTYAVWSAVGAIRPKFVVPATWKSASGKGGATSMVFYKGILDTNPVEWGRTFEDQSKADAAELKATYAKNYIAEAYLVAQKVAEKLQALEPGIRALRAALVLLMIFFAAYVTTITAVNPTRSSVVPTASSAKST